MDIRGNCAEIRPQLGVYLTGAIFPADRALVVRHLSSCWRCREELTSLAGLPGLLHRPPGPAAAERPAPSGPAEGAAAQTGEPSGALPPEGAVLSEGVALSEGVLLRRVLRRVASVRRRNRWLLAAAAVILACGVATGWVMRLTGQPASGQVISGTLLETRTIGGVTVLTNAQGLTLYWYTPDTPTASDCNGSCARQWPPVAGPGIAGDDMTGTLGSIARSDGSLQATYNGHPLYTASVDTVPGQARGNDVHDSGGVWHEVVVSGQEERTSPASSSGGDGY